MVRGTKSDRDVVQPDSFIHSRSSVGVMRPTGQSLEPAKTGLRLEGPYFTAVDPSRYHTVICFVAGTGVSGAIAIAGAFQEMKRKQATSHAKILEEGRVGEVGSALVIPEKCTWQRCVVFWSVRADDYVDLPFLTGKARLPMHKSYAS